MSKPLVFDSSPSDADVQRRATQPACDRRDDRYRQVSAPCRICALALALGMAVAGSSQH
jgi:hypothetical protein